MPEPRRLDVELIARGLARSRGHAQELIAQGAVTVPGVDTPRPSTRIDPDTQVDVADGPRWVGRAAGKLLAALDAFAAPRVPGGVDVAGRRCLDVGASTGGFTQVLLRAGAAHVVALDVGHGQLVPELADDPRVTDLPGVNIRDVRPGELGDPFDIIVGDLSFISLTLVLPVLATLAGDDAHLILLVKPQFEVGRERLGKGGVVTSEHERQRAVEAVVRAAAAAGFEVSGLIESPVSGGAGNRESLLWVRPRAAAASDVADVPARDVSSGKDPA